MRHARDERSLHPLRHRLSTPAKHPSDVAHAPATANQERNRRRLGLLDRATYREDPPKRTARIGSKFFFRRKIHAQRQY